MPASPRPHGKRPARPWAVTANAWLLLLEALGFVILGAWYGGPLGVRWPLALDVTAAERLATLTAIAFGVLAALALWAALGLFRLLPAGWVSAVSVQGATLLLALLLYFDSRPSYVYVLMLVGIFMVLYLHQADVQAAFRQPAQQPQDD